MNKTNKRLKYNVKRRTLDYTNTHTLKISYKNQIKFKNNRNSFSNYFFGGTQHKFR